MCGRRAAPGHWRRWPPSCRRQGLQPAATAAVTGVLRSGLHRDGPGGLFYLASPDGTPRLGRNAPDLAGRRRSALRCAGGCGRDHATSGHAARHPGTQRPFWHARPRSVAGRVGDILRRAVHAGAVAGIRAAPSARATPTPCDAPSGTTTTAGAAIRRPAISPSAAWMLQACEAWHAQTDDSDVAAYAFAMADWALALQHGADHPHPLWVGAYGPAPGIGTAAYTEGMLRALELALRVKDEARAARYLESVQLSMRFLLQLTLEPADLAFSGGTEHRGAVACVLEAALAALRSRAALHHVRPAGGGAGDQSAGRSRGAGRAGALTPSARCDRRRRMAGRVTSKARAKSRMDRRRCQARRNAASGISSSAANASQNDSRDDSAGAGCATKRMCANSCPSVKRARGRESRWLRMISQRWLSQRRPPRSRVCRASSSTTTGRQSTRRRQSITETGGPPLHAASRAAAARSARQIAASAAECGSAGVRAAGRIGLQQAVGALERRIQ